MKNLLIRLTRSEQEDILSRILQAWRVWLLGALVGGLAAVGWYTISPPVYQAEAIVLVDHNLEEAWTYVPDRFTYNFLFIETRLLEGVAWSDEVLDIVVEQHPNFSLETLREEKLILKHPAGGEWYFVAESADPQLATSLAQAWANAFAEVTMEMREPSAEAERVRKEINDFFAENPDFEPADAGQLITQLEAYDVLTYGVSPYINISRTGVEDPSVSPQVEQGVYILLGSVLGALGFALAALVAWGAKDISETA